MTVKFIRHYEKLETPYDDWKNLSLDQYSDLAEGKVDPSIDRRACREHLLNNFQREDFLHYSLIATSELRRAVDTGEMIKDLFDLKSELVVNKNLNEVFWKPKSMISPEDFEKAKIERGLRLHDQRIKQFLEGTAPVSVGRAFRQLEAVDRFLRRLKYKNVLCITHSFFLKMLHLFFVRGVRRSGVLNERALFEVKAEGLLVEV